jgi:hypothetical protein
MADSFRSCYDEAKRLILEENDLDGAMRCLCAALPQSQRDRWLWTDLLAAVLFARGQYWHCLLVVCSYDCRYPDEPRARCAIQIVTTRFLPARCEAEDRRGS